MKNRFFFLTLASFVLLAAGCTTKEATSLSNIQLSASYLSVPAGGGTAELIVTATENWAFAKSIKIPEEKDKDGNIIKESYYAEFPLWIKGSTTSGTVGQTRVTFTVEACEYGREQELQITVGNNTQYLILRQGEMAAVKATCKEVIEGADGKTFTVKGVCTSIVNTNYGNWYLKDDTGEIYIYGTIDANGQYNWNSFNIEIGDVVEVQGPKTTYNETVELVDVSVIKVTKSLLKLMTSKAECGKDGGEFTVKAAYKGNGVFVKMPETWRDGSSLNGAVSITSMDYVKGVPTKIETNPADTAVIKFQVAPNTGDSRSCTLTISSANSGGSSSADFVVSQETGLASYFNETFAEGQGDFTITDITPRSDDKAIWSHSTEYKCMVATGGSKVETESLLISPEIDLGSATAATLSFYHAGKYFGDQQYEWTLWLSSNDGETWTQLLIPNYPKDWNFINSGDISLAAFCGKKVKLAFRYRSTTEAYGTWEIQRVFISALAPELSCIADINNHSANTEQEWTATLTDAVVTYTNGNSAFIQDKTGGIQLYKNNHGLTAGMVINGSVKGKSVLYNQYAEATAWDISAATVTDGPTPEPTTLTLKKLLQDYLRYQNCFIQLNDVTFDTPITKSNRNGSISQDDFQIAVYAQVKNTLEMSGSGNLLCFPTRYNEKLQLGVWDNAHFFTR